MALIGPVPSKFLSSRSCTSRELVCNSPHENLTKPRNLVWFFSLPPRASRRKKVSLETDPWRTLQAGQVSAAGRPGGRAGGPGRAYLLPLREGSSPSCRWRPSDLHLRRISVAAARLRSVVLPLSAVLRLSRRRSVWRSRNDCYYCLSGRVLPIVIAP